MYLSRTGVQESRIPHPNLPVRDVCLPLTGAEEEAYDTPTQRKTLLYRRDRCSRLMLTTVIRRLLSPFRPEPGRKKMKGYPMRDRYENPTWLKTQMRLDGHGIYRWLDSKQIPSSVPHRPRS